MPNKMLIDATHPEETRVVVVRGNRVEEFDFETAQRRQLRGNIYLAKVTRVEPSLQAAFVEYGGNRHGFLAFSEIHPDYYRIPVADREALMREDLEEAEAEEQRPRRNRGDRDRNRRRDRNQANTAGAPQEQDHDHDHDHDHGPELIEVDDHHHDDVTEIPSDHQVTYLRDDAAGETVDKQPAADA